MTSYFKPITINFDLKGGGGLKLMKNRLGDQAMRLGFMQRCKSEFAPLTKGGESKGDFSEI